MADCYDVVTSEWEMSDASKPLSIALEMHMKSAKKREETIATLTRELDEAKAGAAVATERWVKAEAERDAARAEVQRLQGALERIGATRRTGYGVICGICAARVEVCERDWDELCCVGAVARRAIRPPEVDPTSTPAKKESPPPPREPGKCATCDDRRVLYGGHAAGYVKCPTCRP